MGSPQWIWARRLSGHVSITCPLRNYSIGFGEPNRGICSIRCGLGHVSGSGPRQCLGVSWGCTLTVPPLPRPVSSQACCSGFIELIALLLLVSVSVSLSLRAISRLCKALILILLPLCGTIANGDASVACFFQLPLVTFRL